MPKPGISGLNPSSETPAITPEVLEFLIWLLRIVYRDPSSKQFSEILQATIQTAVTTAGSSIHELDGVRPNASKEQLLKIQDVAQRAHVSIRKIRYEMTAGALP